MVLLGAVLLVLPLNGCGPDPEDAAREAHRKAVAKFVRQSPEKIVSAALSAMDDATTAHMTVSQAGSGAHYNVDISTTGRRSCGGSVVGGGARGQFATVQGASFVKGNRTFWTQAAITEAQFDAKTRGRWVKVRSNPTLRGLCEISGFFDENDEELGDLGNDQMEVGKVVRFHGHQVVELRARDDNEQYLVLIEVAEPHRILRFGMSYPNGSMKVIFDFDAKVKIDLPRRGEYVVAPRQLIP